MVTLKNNFGVEPDKDSAVMNVSEGSGTDAKSSVSGHPKALLICRRNSHPFQARTLILNTPAKIGRSVARARPSSYNGIFDCKVLSRNHAVIWYEYDAGKFMIQDTKSSNGTFVNSQRLSKGGETSLPREFFSRDVIQFGVNVLENQRKGNEESDNSDESNHIVTHGCIVATVRLFHPNGKESKSGEPYSTPSPIPPIPQEKICKLELIIHEAQQRENRLHDKLEELQLVVGKLEVACNETLTNRFEETRLLSKIANLEKQTKVMSKAMSGGGKASEKVEAEVQQLLGDIEKLQNVARDIQERQHRKLLESEQKLIEAQRVASNLELEVIALREQASLSELHRQEMGAKCNAYCQTIDILKSNYQAQIELTQKLESQMSRFEEREGERETKNNLTDISIIDKYKFITDETDEEANKKEKENQDVILERFKNFEDFDKVEEKDFINEDDKTAWLIKKIDCIADALSSGLEHITNCIGQLEGTLMDVERSKKKIEKLCIRSHALSLELEAAKMPTEEIEKTENDFDNELYKPVNIPTVSNEKITELEMELEENEELVNQARFKQRESEAKYTKLRCELDVTIKRCEKLTAESYNLKLLLKNHLNSLEEDTNAHRQKIVKLESEIEKLEDGQDQKLLEILGKMCKNTEAKETQTLKQSASEPVTNIDAVDGCTQTIPEERVEKSESIVPLESSTLPDAVDAVKCKIEENPKKQEKNEEFPNKFSKIENEFNQQIEREDSTGSTVQNLGAWEKIQKVQSVLSDQLATEKSLDSDSITDMKNTMNLLAEDLVHLLLREQQLNKVNQCLQEKLNKPLPHDGPPLIGLAVS
ncbi:hypothetical protein RUM44_006370 [Polyplax serrata]|uniref:FHA domain-containing protein n=1 Tax=Polyplax serrata TaxID=468196 RepID=A0ABR1AHX7_POLSC